MNRISEKLKTLETQQIKDMIMLSMTDYKDSANIDIVLQESLNELESRISETEFCKFCEKI